MPDEIAPNDSPPNLELEPTVPALDDKQRAKLIEFFEANPDCGYKRAIRSLGGAYARATKAEALAIVEADDDLVEASQRALRLDKPTLLKAVGEIAANQDHKDRLRAITFALSAIHGVTDQRGQLDVNHSGEVRNPDVADAVERLNALVAAAAVRAAAGSGPPQLPRES